MDQHPGLRMGETAILKSHLEVTPHQARHIRQHETQAVLPTLHAKPPS
jgi:hypothetical protein